MWTNRTCSSQEGATKKWVCVSSNIKYKSCSSLQLKKELTHFHQTKDHNLMITCCTNVCTAFTPMYIHFVPYRSTKICKAQTVFDHIRRHMKAAALFGNSCWNWRVYWSLSISTVDSDMCFHAKELIEGVKQSCYTLFSETSRLCRLLRLSVRFLERP